MAVHPAPASDPSPEEGRLRDVLLQSIAPPSARDPALAYLASLSPNGRRTMAERLRSVAGLVGAPPEAIAWHALRFVHVEAIRQRLLERGVAPKTVNLTLTALRGI